MNTAIVALSPHGTGIQELNRFESTLLYRSGMTGSDPEGSIGEKRFRVLRDLPELLGTTVREGRSQRGTEDNYKCYFENGNLKCYRCMAN